MSTHGRIFFLADMLLSCMIILSLVIGSSSFLAEERLCYGDKLTFPRTISPPKFKGLMHFTPMGGGSKRLVIADGVVKDPRITIIDNRAYMTDLRERDAGTFSVSFTDGFGYDAIKLFVSYCAKPESQYYGETYYASVSGQIEYVEYFTRLSEPVVMWNRSDPQTSQGGRGQVIRKSLRINSVTQEDNGCYDLREKDGKLLSRIMLTVTGRILYTKKDSGEMLFIKYPSANSAWTVIVKLKEVLKTVTLVDKGTLLTESNQDAYQFIGRVELLHDGFKINPLETSDSGIYEFKDPQNHIGLTVDMEVKTAFPSPMVIGFVIAAVIIAGIFCYCCVARCRRKKRYSNRSRAVPQTAAAPPVYDHTQTSGPSYSVARAQDQSYQPVTPGVSGATAASSSEPPTYSTVTNTPLYEVSPLAGDASAPKSSSDFLSSDPGPRFELKGLKDFASPLSSDSTAHNVYSSDKLNSFGVL